MKKAFRVSCLAVAILFTTFGCKDDDEVIQITIQDLDIAIDENPNNGQSLGVVEANVDGSLGFTIVDQSPEGALEINASTGELTVADSALFDFETNPVITVSVSISGSESTGAVTINLNDLDEISVEDLTIAIDENPIDGQSVGTVQVTGAGTLSFSITSQTPNGALEINSSTGELTVADSNLFDFETNPVITANVSVTNSTYTLTIDVTVNLSDDINEISAQDLTVAIDENPTDAHVGSIQASSGASLSYSISSQNPAGALVINASTGEVEVANGNLFDYETNPVITAVILIENADYSVSVNANISLNDLPEIGEFKEGGVIFWIDPTSNNTSGLVVSVDNLSFGGTWGCKGTSIAGAQGLSIGDGASNTTAIEAGCTTADIAADLAANLSLNGFDDWFLPSRDELYEVFSNAGLVYPALNANGGSVPNQFFWSSTENSFNPDDTAILVNLTTGSIGAGSKDFLYGVRAVRAF